MCTGEIVAPVGRPDISKRSFGLRIFLKRFWERITCSSVSLDESKVNMCLNCGDLKINGEWQRIPYPQKLAIRYAIESGQISINGYLVTCNFCLSMEKEINEGRKNLYQDQMSICSDLERVSSMSF